MKVFVVVVLHACMFSMLDLCVWSKRITSRSTTSGSALTYPFLAVPRGGASFAGGGGGEKGAGGTNNNTNYYDSTSLPSASASTSTSPTNPFDGWSNLDQSTLHDATSAYTSLQKFQSASDRLHDIMTRCRTMDDQTTSTLHDLELDLMKLSIQTTVLPPGLIPASYTHLQHELSSLHVDAVAMHSKLKTYIAILEESLTLLQTLIHTIMQLDPPKNDDLLLELEAPNPNNSDNDNSNHDDNRKEPQQQQPPPHSLTKRKLYWQRIHKQFTELLRRRPKAKDAARDQELKHMIHSTSLRMEELERQAQEHVWKEFMELVRRVQNKALRMDQFVKSMHTNQNSNNNWQPQTNIAVASSDDAASTSWLPLEQALSISPVLEEPLEIEVEMTTFQYNW